jgi:membrane-associated protease RseP (regulator of RpoE activity)
VDRVADFLSGLRGNLNSTTLSNYYNAADPVEALRSIVGQVMRIDDATLGEPGKFYVRFRGKLVMDSVEAYARVADKFRAMGYTALFRKDGGAETVVAVQGVIAPRPSRSWVSWLLMGLTFVSVLLAGAGYGFIGGTPTTPFGWLAWLASGWPYMVSLMSILLAHEFGHYLVARYHKVAVTLPNFIPLPFLSPFGTMGAFIQLKSPPTNRRVLLDIGVAGPLAGFVVAVPILLFGLMTSTVQPLPANVDPGTILEGNSILYILAKLAVFGKLLPLPATFGNLPPLLYMARYYLLGIPAPLGGADVMLNQVAWAGWVGLLVTGLNLIPAGQLDGGHAMYVLFGEKRARQFLPVILVVLLGLGIFWTGWFLWAALIFFFGRIYAEPLDQITPLDTRRKILAAVALVLFVLVITPIPLREVIGAAIR